MRPLAVAKGTAIHYPPQAASRNRVTVGAFKEIIAICADGRGHADRLAIDGNTAQRKLPLGLSVPVNDPALPAGKHVLVEALKQPK